MMRGKLERLKEILNSMGKVLVAFSGGVDSTFLLKVALDTLGPENVLAVTALSPIRHPRETQEAKALASQLGAKHLLVESNELANPAFTANPPDRCYHCKRLLMERLVSIAARHRIPHIIEGSNYDDLGNYRPGRKALAEFGVRSPLLEAGLTKAEIRELSRQMGLPTWNKPPMSCLATRIPFAQTITEDRLRRIERAEEILWEMGFRLVRVRDHGELARIETAPDEMERLWAERAEIAKALKEVGYRFVTIDLEGYRPSVPVGEIKWSKTCENY